MQEKTADILSVPASADTDTILDALRLSGRARNALLRNQCMYVSDVIKLMNDRKLESLESLGQVSAEEIVVAVKEYVQNGGVTVYEVPFLLSGKAFVKAYSPEEALAILQKKRDAGDLAFFRARSQGPSNFNVVEVNRPGKNP